MRTFLIKGYDYSKYTELFSTTQELNLPKSVNSINIMYEEGKSGSIQIGDFLHEIDDCANDCHLDFDKKSTTHSNFGWKRGKDSSTKELEIEKLPEGVESIHYAYDNGRVSLEVNGIEVLKCLTSYDFGIEVELQE